MPTSCLMCIPLFFLTSSTLHTFTVTILSINMNALVDYLQSTGQVSCPLCDDMCKRLSACAGKGDQSTFLFNATKNCTGLSDITA